MTLLNKNLSGLYLITPALAATKSQEWLTRIEDAVRGGAKVVQFRDKSNDEKNRLQIASQLLELCHGYQIPLIINDDVSLAIKIQAHGVHLGRSDMALEQARQSLGPDAIIGVSCYNQLSLGKAAQAAGADYVAFGRFFPSLTKPNAVQADLTLLIDAVKTLRCPIVAIGGITLDNAPSVIGLGANAIAVIDAVFSEPDTRQAAQRLQGLF